VAQSSFSGLSKNIAGMTTAQQEFNSAVTKSQLAKATADQAKALKGLSADQQQLVFDTADAKNSWRDFVKSSADGVDSTLLPVLGLIPKALADARKFMGPVEQSLTGLGQHFARAFSSKGAQDLIGKLAILSGKSITAFGTALGNVAKGAGGLFKDLVPHANDLLGPVVKITGEFAKWGTSKATAGGVTKLFDFFKKEGPLVGKVIRQIGEEIPKIVKALGSMGGTSLSGISVILTVIGKLSPGQLAAIAGGILLIRTATNLWKIAQAGLNLIMETNPIILILTGIVVAVVLVVKYHKQLEAIAKKVWHAISEAAVKVWDAIKKGAEAFINWIKGHWPLILAILTGPIGLAVLFIVKHWKAITDGAKNMLHDIVSFFTSLPGRILHALGDLGKLLYNSGAKIVQGLIDGIMSMVGKVENVVGSVVSTIKSYLPFSPARKGPLSGSGAPVNSGRSIARQLAQGLAEGIPGVSGTMARLAGNVTPRGRYGGGPGGPGGGGALELRIRFDAGDGDIMTAIMKRVRIMGGDPGMFHRKVVFR
jgi:hypothetical protein